MYTFVRIVISHGKLTIENNAEKWYTNAERTKRTKRTKEQKNKKK